MALSAAFFFSGPPGCPLFPAAGLPESAARPCCPRRGREDAGDVQRLKGGIYRPASCPVADLEQIDEYSMASLMEAVARDGIELAPAGGGVVLVQNRLDDRFFANVSPAWAAFLPSGL